MFYGRKTVPNSLCIIKKWFSFLQKFGQNILCPVVKIYVSYLLSSTHMNMFQASTILSAIACLNLCSTLYILDILFFTSIF